MSACSQTADRIEAETNVELLDRVLRAVAKVFPSIPNLSELERVLDEKDVIVEFKDRQVKNEPLKALGVESDPAVSVPGSQVLATVIASIQHIYAKTGSLEETFKVMDGCSFLFTKEQGYELVHLKGGASDRAGINVA